MLNFLMAAFLKKPVVLVLIIAIVIVIAVFASRGGTEEPATATAARGAVTQEVSVTGKVVPAEEVDLAFEKSGRAAWVAVKVGDAVYRGQTLVTLENADASAELAQAEANLAAEKADLAGVEATPRDARQNLTDKLRDAYTRADDAIRGKTDQFFSNPGTQPALLLQAETAVKNSIEFQRVTLGATLAAWRDGADAAQTRRNLYAVAAYLDDISLVVNALTPTPKLSQTAIDTYRSDVLAARTNINTALANLTAAEEKLRAAEDAIAPQKANVDAAEAKVAYYRVQLAKTALRSPIEGVVAEVNIKAGELVAANAAAVSVISAAEYEIEAKVPEVDIAKLAIGDEATVTLDAYGSAAIFKAKIAKFDPAETVVDGVPTYTTTFQFLARDERIRSGMTANIKIVTEKKEDAILLPGRAIRQKNGGSAVRLFRNGAEMEMPVEIGIRGADGMVEIISGISEGDIIYVPD